MTKIHRIEPFDSPLGRMVTIQRLEEGMAEAIGKPKRENPHADWHLEPLERLDGPCTEIFWRPK